jgi:hypothetical protein
VLLEAHAVRERSLGALSDDGGRIDDATYGIRMLLPRVRPCSSADRAAFEAKPAQRCADLRYCNSAVNATGVVVR